MLSNSSFDVENSQNWLLFVPFSQTVVSKLLLHCCCCVFMKMLYKNCKEVFVKSTKSSDWITYTNIYNTNILYGLWQLGEPL